MSLRHATSLAEAARADLVAGRECAKSVAGQLQEILDGSSQSTAEAAVESSQAVLQRLDDAIALLVEAVAELFETARRNSARDG